MLMLRNLCLLIHAPLRQQSTFSLILKMNGQQKGIKRFAPLDPAKPNKDNAPPLKGIVFDVDGTLWYVALIH